MTPVDVNTNFTTMPVNYKTMTTNLINIPTETANKMTIGGKLNKFCSNIAFARNFAGIHYRSDAEVSFTPLKI